MAILLAVLLGVIQGVTEFLPISSTAHMTIFGHLCGMLDPQHPERWTATIAIVQLGTLGAVLAYFAGDVRTITAAVLRQTFVERIPPHRQGGAARLGWLVVGGSIPIGVLGLAFRSVIEGPLTKNPLLIVAMLASVAFLMLYAERMPGQRLLEELNFRDAVVVGIAQAMALLPGASRSGTTISVGLLLGYTREAAARFSFLLSIPALLASGLLELVSALQILPSADLQEVVIATLVAALSGYGAIAFLLHYLRTHRLDVFAYYRLGIAVLIGVLLWNGVLQ
ncbi:MAG: undecaprenyl-diphosphate phosphatase [Bacteroidota bacterium]|nr:UDP-diphosphatase [Candidatus Kapabacteria bacterium]MDW8075911.1 undecaprenyl-diphosphate phosphatase [Bacteroidota bacterium]MDW8271729.1 undecaprenyl-diphosphate phosphatase [Bacteroidota bacterium]